MIAAFRGLSAFPITPCSDDGVVNEAALSAMIERISGAQVNSIGLLGSTGTYAYLDREQRRRAVAAAAKVKGTVPLIVGVGAMRTDSVVALASDAADQGADGLLLAPVSYTPLTDDEVFSLYHDVSTSTDLPICIYNNPSTTHFTFSTSLLERLAALKGIAAVKMPPPTQGDLAEDLGRLRRALPDDFVIGYSGDWVISDALLAGADAFYSALAGTLPHTFGTLAKAASAKDVEVVNGLNRKLAPIWDLCRRYGSLRLAYALNHRLGHTDAQLPRPLLPIDDKGMQKLDGWLTENQDLAR
ncbi:dihydrodipicolinate synthase family protein [Yoonia litorea]|uniref:4-hydroxy-tetrahydrodipicolinate synthase n=1 Tax=Yoonia litorea TaxID=1123755 RepID=A0A1I6MUK0_9RHOB|nr:dihydrodipicolinate synthase family protein [Yoonia litorea]SFS19375.1 4-hydroxy-tetrahydrodipicolinate synthase [Yoonia litorea]